MRKKAKVFLWIVILAAVVAAFASTAVRRLSTEEVQSIESVQRAEGIPVDYVQSRVTPVEDWREFVGVAEGFEQVDLESEYRTRVTAVRFPVGSEVRASEVVVSLDPYDPARSMMNLETARAQYASARRDSLRMEELFKSGAISQQELDHVRAQSEASHASYRIARRAVDLDSPISGVLTALYVKRGDYADAGEVVATIASYDKIRIPLDVSSSQRALIALGQEVRVRADEHAGGGGHVLEGTVVRAALSADTETRLFHVEVVLDNKEHLMKPGSLVTPEILVASTHDAPVLPRVALMSRNGASQVYVIGGSDDDRHATLRTVTPGLIGGAFVAITGGLKPGDLVVVRGQSKLEDGVKVKLHADVTSEYFAATETGAPAKETAR
jgi:multidrug efflux system membrane fusion protein